VQSALALDEPPAQVETINPLKLVLKIIALLTGVVVLLVGTVFLLPDGNDYALATLDKHARLEMNAPRKIVFLGGSNLAYGIDSLRIEHELGIPVVNMGMNGYLGVRFMLEEAKRDLKPSDIAVISLEYDSYYKPTIGTGADLLMIVKARPRSIVFLNQWQQVAQVVEAVPFAAQQKMLRMIQEKQHAIKSGILAALGRPRKETVDEQFQLINSIECHAGFNDRGDLTSHLGVKWPYEREQGVEIMSTKAAEDVVDVLRTFSQDMKRRGVHVYILPTPVLQSYYDRHKESLTKLYVLLRQTAGLDVLAPPTEFVFPEPLFFDTVYHLNREGRAIRTGKIIEELKPRFMAENRVP
jgi:hypothetical protein